MAQNEDEKKAQKTAKTLIIGKIEWAFGYNNKKKRKNRIGILNSEAELHESMFRIENVEPGSRLLSEYARVDFQSRVESGTVVYEEKFNIDTISGYEATHVQYLDEASKQYLKENLKLEMFTHKRTAQILIEERPDVIFGDRMQDYFPYITFKKARVLFQEKREKGIFKESLCQGLRNYLQNNPTCSWPASNWSLFNYDEENIEELIELYQTADKHGFDVSALFRLAPRIWINNPEMISEVPRAVIQDYYKSHPLSREEFFFLMDESRPDYAGRAWIAGKAERNWLLEAMSLFPYWREEEICEYIQRLKFENTETSYREQAAAVLRELDPHVFPEAATFLIEKALEQADTSWDPFLPPWVRDPSQIPKVAFETQDDSPDDESIGIYPSSGTGSSIESGEESTKEQVTEDFEDDPEYLEYIQKYKITTDFSVDQRRAIQATDGIFLLFAIPGSGKTTVIINRLAYMIYKKKKISPSAILCVTFGNDAAKHMKDEYLQLTRNMSGDGYVGNPQFSTIHGLCREIISEGMGRNAPKLITDSSETERQMRPSTIIGRLAEEIQQKKQRAEKEAEDGDSRDTPRNKKTEGYRSLDEKNELAEKITSAVGYIANRCLKDNPDKIREIRIIDEDEEIEIGPIYERYQDYLEKNNLMDHDRSQTLAFEILCQNQSLLEKKRETYRYICVDEAQDVSTIQYKIIKLLVGETGNLFMVGDDDQSIFGFRGADPKEMLAFTDLFPQGKRLTMGTNYRSRPEIVNSANAFIQHNLIREKKPMRASKQEHALIRHISFEDMQTELELLAEEAKRFRDIPGAAESKGSQKRTLAILYRRNISALPIMVALESRGIGFNTNVEKLKTTFNNFVNYSAATDLILLLRLSKNLTDFTLLEKCYPALGLYLLRIQINKARRYHRPGRSVFEAVRMVLDEERGEVSNQIFDLDDRERLIHRIGQMRPFDAICEMMNRFDYSARVRGTSQWFSVYTLLSMALSYTSTEVLLERIDNLGQSHKVDENLILTTMHSSKGQQYDKVIVLDAIEDFTPGNMQTREDYSFDPEEERRIFYVALTRAESEIDIFQSKRYFGHYYNSSPYVDEFVRGNPTVKMFSWGDLKKWNMDHSPERTFYAIRAGENAGVYYAEKTAKEKGKGQEIRKFSNRQQADAWLFRCPENLKFSLVRKALTHPQDLPVKVEEGIMRLFDVNSLAEMTIESRKKLWQRAQFLFSNKNGAVDYSACAKEYALIYLPVNYYKIWVPLYTTSRMGILPLVSSPMEPVRILELGAGPGTSTLSILQYYAMLAEENQTEIYLDYKVMEYEKAFLVVLWQMLYSLFGVKPETGKYLKMGRLHCHFRFQQGDAFALLRKSGDKSRKFNLIFESNMINGNEHVDEHTTANLAEDLPSALQNFGLVLLIEPADRRIDMLEDLTRRVQYNHSMRVLVPAKYAESDLTKINMVKEAVKFNLRQPGQDRHKFRYSIFRKE